MSKPVVDDERPKFGCAGRAGARDMREPDCERECCVYGAAEFWRLEAEVERFMADAGIGIADRFGFRPPRVCCRQYCGQLLCTFSRETRRAWTSQLTSRGRRTDMMGNPWDSSLDGTDFCCLSRIPGV